jgi:hypothetical protein
MILVAIAEPQPVYGIVNSLPVMMMNRSQKYKKVRKS